MVLLLQWYFKVYDASADFLLFSKVPRLGAPGRDLLEGLASHEHAKEVAARRLMKSWDDFVALHHAVLASPLRRTRLPRHLFSSMTMRNLSTTMSLATLAIVLILSE